MGKTSYPPAPTPAMQKAARDHAESRFRHHLADGETWIGVYENKAFDSASAGHRIAMFFDLKDWDAAIMGKRAPEHHQVSSWKYLLIGKAKTVDEALALMHFAEDS